MDLTKEKEYVEKLKGITPLEWSKVKMIVDRYFEYKQREHEKTLTLSEDEIVKKVTWSQFGCK